MAEAVETVGSDYSGWRGGGRGVMGMGKAAWPLSEEVGTVVWTGRLTSGPHVVLIFPI
jgi:hypothetical protein